jgi:hypothetical protein
MNYVITTNHYFQEKVQFIEENQYKNNYLSICIQFKTSIENIKVHLSEIGCFLVNLIFKSFS